MLSHTSLLDAPYLSSCFCSSSLHNEVRDLYIQAVQSNKTDVIDADVQVRDFAVFVDYSVFSVVQRFELNRK